MFDHLRQPHDQNAQRYAHLTTAYYDEVTSENEEEDDEVPKFGGMSVDAKIEKCEVCLIDTSELASFKYQHFYPWHQKATIPCTECNATFNRDFQLAAHFQLIHNKNMINQCAKCNKEHDYYRVGSNGRIYSYHYRRKRKIGIEPNSDKIQLSQITDEQRYEFALFAQKCNS